MCLIIIFISLTKSDIPDCEGSKRVKRQLLFPNSTLLQFNAGVATPTPIKTIFFNWAFQANFQLPWNRTQIPLDILEANSGYPGLSRKRKEVIESTSDAIQKIEYENDAKLYHFYKYVEDILNGFGHNGSSCVLRALCHLGAEPLHNGDEEDLLHELANFVLNPENDATDDETTTKDALPYIKAFKSGESVKYCIDNYKCSLSLIDMFTKLHYK
ncbi:unnamed protein product, partial [Iphiclides podalirius]